MAQTQGPTLEPIATQSLVGQTSPFRDAIQRFFNNVTGLLEYQRTANVFKTAQIATTGNIWTPSAATLKFRLMGYTIELPSNCAISGGGVVCTVTLQDGSGNAISGGISHDFFVPTTAVTTGNGATVVNVTLPGNGYLSTTPNNILVANISTALTTGKFRINAWGTEE